MTEANTPTAPSADLSHPPPPKLTRRILALALPEWRPLGIGLFALALSSGATLAYPKLIERVMDLVSGTARNGTLNGLTAILIAVFLLQAVAGGIRYYLFTDAGERIVANLRSRLFEQLAAQDIAFFDTRRTGELMSRLSSDTTVLQNTVSVNVSMLLRNVAGVFGGLVLLLITSAKLTGIMLVVVPPITIGAILLGRRIRTLSRESQDGLAHASELAEETFSGIRTIRTFAQEALQAKHYDDRVQAAYQLTKRRTTHIALFTTAASFAGFGAIAIVFWVGGRMVIADALSVGELTSFVLYTLILAFSLGALGGVWGDIMKATGAAQRVFELLDSSPTIESEGLAPASCTGAVELADVHFRYPSRPDTPVLIGVNFKIEPGEIVALVGPSGGGKSTVASLLCRLYDTDTGAIRIDGADIRTLSTDWLRTQVGVVSQEPTLFSFSIADNIRFGRLTATDDEVRVAARMANAEEFIDRFPDGFETEVGERGVRLSGGQRQRIAIARAILRDPRILILDEATSALDAESEFQVQEALDRLMGERTTLVIAHRLSTVRDASRVLVVDHGQIVESGTHEELLAQNGLYQQLVARQFVEKDTPSSENLTASA